MTPLRPLTLALLLALTGCYAGTPELTAANVAPRSLAGTAVDGALHLDPRGAFVFDEGARQAFDYYLTADGELEPAELGAWVRAELGRRLPADAAEDAFAAWEAYLAFRAEAAATLSRPQDDLAAAERGLLAALDDQLGDYSIAADERSQISRAFALQRIAALTGEARERALAGFVDEQPDEAAAFVQSRREIAAAQLAGESDLGALRSLHYGDEAAVRLAALDERRAVWSRRVEALRGEREALRGEHSGAELDAAIAALEARHFSPKELRRVHALDRIAGE